MRLTPAAATTKWPPKNCPVCGQAFGPSEHARNVHEAWDFYRSHLHIGHPEYESWIRRASWIYSFPVTLITLPLLAGVFQTVPTGVTPLVFDLSWASALGTLVAGFAIKNSGKRRFRRLWKQQHGGPLTPLWSTKARPASSMFGRLPEAFL